MNIWAISDLHLGFSTGKWMDLFGEQWRDHHAKVEAAWRERISPRDIVLVPGDLSWAMRPLEVERDLAWFGALPGRKIIVKGNHDYWWPGSRRKLRALLPGGVHAIKKTAIVVDGVPVIGVRGCDFLPREDESLEALASSIERERRELLMSIDHLRRIYDGGRPPMAMFHYPPYRMGSRESAFTRILEDAGCSHCVFGHLHLGKEWERVFQGEEGGVKYRLVSCDALEFTPLLLEADVPAPGAGEILGE